MAAPTYAPQQCWVEALTATSCKLWWSNVNSSANCRLRIERSVTGEGDWTFVGYVAQDATRGPTLYDVEVVSGGTYGIIKRQDNGDFELKWFFHGAQIAIEPGGTMVPSSWVKVYGCSPDSKQVTLYKSGLTPGHTARIAQINWMGNTVQQYYIDTGAPTNSKVFYRLRTEESDGSNPTDWAQTPHWTKTPPNNTTPAIPETFDYSVPACSGHVHSPSNATELRNLLDGLVVDGHTLVRGDIIELQPPSYYEGALMIQASDNSFNRATGSWITDGFAQGQNLTVEWTTYNNGRYVISSVTANKLTVSSSLTDESPTNAVLWYSPYADQYYYFRYMGATTGNRNQDYILIRSASHSSLPPEGERIGWDYRRYMPVLRSSTVHAPCFCGVCGTGITPPSHFYLLGLRFTRPGVDGDNLRPLLRTDCDSYEIDNAMLHQDVPHHFIVDRCEFDGTSNPDDECIRGACLNCNYGAIINSWVHDLQYSGSDGQCVLGNALFGPTIIRNNALWGDGIAETVMLGGSGNRGAGFGHADVTIEYNLMDRQGKFNRQSPDFNFKPDWKNRYSNVVVVASTSTYTTIAKQDGSKFDSSHYCRDRIKIQPGGSITPGTYEILDRSSNDASSQLMIDLANQTPGGTAVLAHCNGYVVKNTLEIKCGHRVTIQYNILRNCPNSGQRGDPFLMTQKNAGLGNYRFFHWPKAAYDVHFRWNLIEYHDGDIQCQTHPQDSVSDYSTNDTQSSRARRVTFEQNLWRNHGERTNFGLFGVEIAQNDVVETDFNGFVVRHNTFHARPYDSRRIWQRYHTMGAAYCTATANKWPWLKNGQWVGNIFTCGVYSVYSSAGTTAEAFRLNVTDAATFTWRDNVWVDVNSTQGAGSLPVEDGLEATNYDAVGWTDYAGGDFSLSAQSPYLGLVEPPVFGEQTNPGVDYVTLMAALASVSGGGTPPPPPEPPETEPPGPDPPAPEPPGPDPFVSRTLVVVM